MADPSQTQNLDQKLEEFKAQSKRYLDQHDWIYTIDIFPGTNEEYEKAYGVKVATIKLPRETQPKGIIISAWERDIYDESSTNKNADGFPYKKMWIRGTGSLSTKEINDGWFRKKNLIAITSAHLLMWPSSGEWVLQTYFGTPVTRVTEI